MDRTSQPSIAEDTDSETSKSFIKPTTGVETTKIKDKKKIIEKRSKTFLVSSLIL